MQKNKISIALQTLNFLEKSSWTQLKLTNIKIDKRNNDFIKKNDLIINLNRYFDYLLKRDLNNIEESSSKDMLFEIFMARLDILNRHRKSIKNLIKYFSSNPQVFIKLTPSFIESIIIMTTMANLNVNGIKGIPKIKAIFILYILIIYTWNSDETSSLEKTMTVLDKYLTNINKIIKFF